MGCFSCASVLEINFSGKHIIETVDVENSDVAGCLVQTLAVLSTTNMSLTNDSVQFYIEQLLKQSGPGKHLGLLRYHKYHDENLCIIKHLNMYVDKTKHLRESDNLLISYQRPHGAVTPETISR